MNDFNLKKAFISTYGTVRYDVQGEGEPLVLVHGTPWSAFNWRNIIPALSQWYTVYYYDLFGYGESEKGVHLDVSLGVQNKIFEELLDHWGLSSPIVIGHDFGGTTALRTHLLGNRDFKKIILIDPVAISPWGSSFFSHVKENIQVFNGIPDYIHEAMVAAYVKGAQFKDMNEETLKGIINPWIGEYGQPAFYSQIAKASQQFTDEIEPIYGQIERPVLIVWGEEDNWIPIKKGRKLHDKIRHSKFVSIPNAGHLVQEDAPTILLSHLLKFLEES